MIGKYCYESGVNRVIAGDNTSTTLNAGLTWKF